MRSRKNHGIVVIFFAILLAMNLVIIGCSSHLPKTIDHQLESTAKKVTVSKKGPALSFEIPELLPNERIISHTGYSLLFNQTKGVAQWVAYSLNPEKNKSKIVKRKNKFYSDPQIVSSPDPNDYTRSGYDRGHLAPAEDMRWSESSMKDSFYMTNMTPQTHKFNAGIWLKLETKIRKWAAMYDEVFIISGPVLTKDCLEKIAKKICVPAEFYKVILEKTGTKMKAIGFIIPHKYTNNDLKFYATSVRAVEVVTKSNFFPQLSKIESDIIETSIEYENW